LPTPAKILVIRFSSIGDIVLTTPVIRALKLQLDAEVHLLTKRSFAGVLSANPYLSKIWQIDKKVSEVIPQLQAEGFTAIVDLHHNLRSKQVKLGLWRVPAYTFDKLNWQKWLLTKWKIDRMPQLHIVDRYLAAAAPLGVKNDGQGLDYHIPDVDQVELSSFGIKGPVVALVIGAAHATKRLSQEQLIALCKKIDQTIVLLGGPADEADGDAIAASGTHVYNLCGKLRLHQSADVLRQSKLVITHDTGLMHMAAALGKPIRSVWGNTVPEFGMYPYRVDNHIAFEVSDLVCRPCSKIGYDRCPKGHFKCMKEQDLAAIADSM
jgi:ADP-heptose:LPS heptosyltransferase